VTSRILLLITPLVFGAQCASIVAVSREPPSVLCGRVVSVNCDGPSGPVRLLLSPPSLTARWQLVILPEHRQLFGPRIEDRYEQRLVCVRPATGTARSERVLVTDPGQIVISDAHAPIPLPDDVARTCDRDVQLPKVIRDAKPQYTFSAMRAKVSGSVFLQAIVDRNGTVRDVKVVQSLYPSLDTAAREALAQWEFLPATRAGEPVAVAISVQMAFTTR
jgi:TonB family protein